MNTNIGEHARLLLLGPLLLAWFSKILRKYRFIHVIAYVCFRAYPHTRVNIVLIDIPRPWQGNIALKSRITLQSAD